MKNKTYVISIALFLSVFILRISFGSQKTEWKGTIEKENGIIVVKNPKKPIYSEEILSLEEELSIGETGGKEEYMFSRARSITVDDEEQIYVLDSKEAHIKVFDKDGKYLRTLGRRGQGPGEMQRPVSIRITPQKEILVNDWGIRRVMFLNLDGEFIREISTGAMTFFNKPKCDSKESIVASFSIMDKEFLSKLVKFDAELKPITTLSSIPISKPPVFNVYFPQYFWDVTNENNVIWGITTKYEFQVIDLQGRLVKKIIKDYNPVKITEEDKEKRLRDLYGDKPPPSGVKVEFSKYFPAFMLFTCDDEGRIFARTYEKATDENEGYYDIFDDEGRYLAKALLKIRPLVWKRKKLYAIEEDEEGFPVIKRYKVNWKMPAVVSKRGWAECP